MSSTINRRKLIAFSAAAGSTLLPGSRAFAQDSTPAASPAAEPVALDEATTISVGAVPVPHGEILQFVQDNLAGDYNLTIETVEFTDYVQPNTALDEGELDANFFQHLPYLEDFNEQHGTELVPVVPVHIEPLGIYSDSIESLDEIEDGAVVAIPNDVTNGGRALKLLEDNGLLTLDPDVDNPTVIDIVDDPKRLEIVELEAAQLGRSLPDTTISVINGNYALEADLTPAEDALALESAEDNPYANYLVVREGDEERPEVVLLGALLNSDEVRSFIEETYEGSVIPAF